MNVGKYWMLCLCAASLLACSEEKESEGNCDPVKEIYRSDTKTCGCNSIANWKGSSPDCYCDTDNGYVLSLDGRTCTRKASAPSCDDIKEIESADGTCTCNSSANWKGTSPNCYCDTQNGYELSLNGRTCSRKTTECDPFKEITTAHGACKCNSDANWKGTSPDCYCDTNNGYELSSDGHTCSPKPDCVLGNTSCDSSTGTFKTCDSSGEWGSESNCTTSTSCTFGSCGQCTSGTKCSASGVETCLTNGMWGEAVACTTSTSCSTGNCGQCTPGNTACDEGKYKTCLPNGMWGTESDCTSSTTCTTGFCPMTCSGDSFNDQCITVGGTLMFGKYPQETDSPDWIEWIVLAKDTTNHQILLLSKHVLDSKAYHTKKGTIPWETCSLRTWLNSDFLNTAFKGGEQTSIATTHLVNPDNPDYGTEGGNDTDDKIFLLTIADAKNTSYFADNAARKSKATAYAIRRGNYANTAEGTNNVCSHIQCTTDWWLRSPGGEGHNSTAYVFSIGSLNTIGKEVTNEHVGVRPALWVNY